MTGKRAGHISTAGVIHRLLEMEGATTVSIVTRNDDRQSDLTQSIIKLLGEADSWSIAEIINRIDPDQAKAIRSSVDYLTRSGCLQRRERGCYVVVQRDPFHGMSREAARDALVLRAYADTFNLARRKIEDLQDEINELKSQMCATCEQRNVDEAAGINYKRGEY